MLPVPVNMLPREAVKWKPTGVKKRGRTGEMLEERSSSSERERENNQSQHYGADGSGSSKCHGGIKRLVPTLHAHVGPRKKYQDGIEECAFICILVFHLFYTENK